MKTKKTRTVTVTETEMLLLLKIKAPQTPPEKLYPEHDFFIQIKKLKNTLRHLVGKDLITHLGLNYYDEE